MARRSLCAAQLVGQAPALQAPCQARLRGALLVPRHFCHFRATLLGPAFTDSPGAFEPRQARNSPARGGSRRGGGGGQKASLSRASVSCRELEVSAFETGRAEPLGHRKGGRQPLALCGGVGLPSPRRDAGERGSSSPRRPPSPRPAPAPLSAAALTAPAHGGGGGGSGRRGRGRRGPHLLSRALANGEGAMQMSGVAWRRGGGPGAESGGDVGCPRAPSAALLRSHEVQGKPAAAAGGETFSLTGLSAASLAAAGRLSLTGEVGGGRRRPARGSPRHPGQAGTAVGAGERLGLPSPAAVPPGTEPQGRCLRGKRRGGQDGGDPPAVWGWSLWGEKGLPSPPPSPHSLRAEGARPVARLPLPLLPANGTGGKAGWYVIPGIGLGTGIAASPREGIHPFSSPLRMSRYRSAGFQGGLFGGLQARKKKNKYNYI